MRLPAVPSLVLLCSCIAFAFPVSATDVPSIKPASRAYSKLMANKIGSLWYREVERNRDRVAIGTVKTTFRITPEGRVEQLKIISNTSNRVLANISASAIEHAKLPRVPRNVLKEQKHNWFDVEELLFTIYP